jgi:hypothetical protein
VGKPNSKPDVASAVAQLLQWYGDNQIPKSIAGDVADLHANCVTLRSRIEALVNLKVPDADRKAVEADLVDFLCRLEYVEDTVTDLVEGSGNFLHKDQWLSMRQQHKQSRSSTKHLSPKQKT